MVRQLVEVLVDVLPVARLERARDLPVHPHAPVRAELLVERGPHQRMRERVAARRAGHCAHEGVARGLVERVE